MTEANLRARNDMNKARTIRGCSGISLVEILVTVLILAIGLLGLAGMQGASLRNNQSAYARTQATNLAYEILDAMRANVTVARTGGYNVGYGSAPSSSGIAQTDLTAWSNRITALLPSGQGQILQNGTTFTIGVRWDDSRGVEAAQEFTVVTQL